MDGHHEMYSPDFVFEFEQRFDYRTARRWMATNWHQAWYWTAIYVLIIFGGRRLMENRPALNLRPLLVVWNVSLAIFSIAGTLRTWPELLHVLHHRGFAATVCSPSYVEQSVVSGYWTWLFCTSKVPELGDTVFVVLRKRPLIFLHWYHHTTVLLFTWYSYAEHIAPGRWYINMNYAVHALMYTYYACQAMGVRLPKKVAMVVTVSQMLQMVVGFSVTFYGDRRRANGEFCQISGRTANLALLMYASYLALFAHFFIKSYLKSGNKVKGQ